MAAEPKATRVPVAAKKRLHALFAEIGSTGHLLDPVERATLVRGSINNFLLPEGVQRVSFSGLIVPELLREELPKSFEPMRPLSHPVVLADFSGACVCATKEEFVHELTLGWHPWYDRRIRALLVREDQAKFMAEVAKAMARNGWYYRTFWEKDEIAATWWGAVRAHQMRERHSGQ